MKWYDIDIGDNDGNNDAKTYVYVDDCMFSGMTVYGDLNRLIDEIPDGSRIITIFMAVHSFAEWWVKTNLDRKMKQKNINLEIWWFGIIGNSGGRNNNYECLWPKEFDSREVQAYLKKIEEESEASPEKKVRLFREDRYTGGPYSSERNRAILEQALMETGLKIIGFPRWCLLEIIGCEFDPQIHKNFKRFLHFPKEHDFEERIIISEFAQIGDIICEKIDKKQFSRYFHIFPVDTI